MSDFMVFDIMFLVVVVGGFSLVCMVLIEVFLEVGF